MTPRDFCYWLHGFFELHQGQVDTLSPVQCEQIRKHLDLVFANVTADPSEPLDPKARKLLMEKLERLRVCAPGSVGTTTTYC